MGKTQSKRSVDITTDPKKGPEEEVTGKMEKIEDVDQKEINGDATIQEKSDAEKKDAEETENDKDLTTEKSSGDAAKGGGDSAEPKSPESAEAESPKEDPNSTKDSAATEEISPLADESIKKSKKDKVKKKWSFRSISFGKKDKQKPAKTEETAETSPTAAAATNGEADKVPEGGESTEEASKKDEGAGDSAGNDGAPTAGETKPTENGNEAKTELNGDNTETVAKTSENNDAAANDTNKTTETTPVVSNDNTANETQTENKAAAEPPTANTTTTAAVSLSVEIVTNGNGNDDSTKNGVADNEDAEPVKAPEGTNVESNKTIPCVEEKPHQNGTNGDANEADEEPEHITNKSQIEVKTISTNNICTSTTSTSTSLNNIVNEQAETLVLTQTTTTTTATSNTSQSFQSNETSNDIILVESSSSNLNSDKNDPPQVQNILPNVQTTISNEQKENIGNFNAVAISDDNNSLKYEKISQKVNDLVNVNVVFIEQQPKTEEIFSEQKKDSLSSSPIVIVDDEIEACSSEVVDQQIEVQAPPPPLPASPPPSRVSVFAFKDNDVDFVEVNEDITTSPPDNIIEDFQKSIDIVNDIKEEKSEQSEQSELIQNHPIAEPISMIPPSPNLDSDIGKNADIVDVDNIETKISNESNDEHEVKTKNNDLIHDIKDDYVFVTNQNEQCSSIPPIATTEIITEQVSVNNDKPLPTMEESVVSHEESDIDTHDDKNLSIASTADNDVESVENLDREQIAAVQTIINEITEKAVEIICDKHDDQQIQNIVDEQPVENKTIFEASSPVASSPIIDISTSFEQNLTTNKDKDEIVNPNDEENVINKNQEEEQVLSELKESLENEIKIIKKSSNTDDVNLIYMQDSLNANENSIDQDNNDASNIESQIENIIQSKIEIEIIKDHDDVDILNIKNQKQLTSIDEDSLNANESKDSSGNSGAVGEDILTSTLTKTQNDDDTKTVITTSISNIDISPKTRLNGNNESLIDDEHLKDINQEQNIIQNVDDNVKEINAKDLKENAAAETTQDLPVTCE